MFKRFVAWVVNKIELKVLLRAATNVASDKAPQIADIVREEVVSLLKQFVFKYLIVLNIIVGFVGFVFGCILTVIVVHL